MTASEMAIILAFMALIVSSSFSLLVMFVSRLPNKKGVTRFFLVSELRLHFPPQQGSPQDIPSEFVLLNNLGFSNKIALSRFLFEP
jgi:hypothetical protein